MTWLWSQGGTAIQVKGGQVLRESDIAFDSSRASPSISYLPSMQFSKSPCVIRARTLRLQFRGAVVMSSRGQRCESCCKNSRRTEWRSAGEQHVEHRSQECERLWLRHPIENAANHETQGSSLHGSYKTVRPKAIKFAYATSTIVQRPSHHSTRAATQKGRLQPPFHRVLPSPDSLVPRYQFLLFSLCIVR